MLPKIIRTGIHRYEGTGVRKTEMATQYRKAYVPVTLDVDKEGAILPRLIWWDNGVIFQIDQILYTRKSPCFLCSWNRRKALFTVAKEQGCNKIALGHHMDDILETLLMNITFQGAFSTMPPKLVMRKFEMTIIRPMCLVHEADLIEMARIRGFRKQIKDCPYESLSNRSNMKEVLYSLEKMNPEARYSLWKCMTNIQEELLPGMNEHDL